MTLQVSSTASFAGTPQHHPRLEGDAIYFSRRAREERQAYARGDCRKSRQVHLELAEAYEFRARLITRELRRLAVNDLLLAL